jgi:NDP-sugar pyrophosphorylase family protein
MTTEFQGRSRVMAVLAGGANTRMEWLRGTIYKAFLPVHGMSFIARHVLRAQAYGFERVDVIVDAADPVLELLACSPDEARLTKSVEVRVLVHAGSQAEKIAWWRLDTNLSLPVMVVLGDTLAPVDLDAMWQAAAPEHYDSVIAVAEIRLPFGHVETAGDQVLGFQERPTLALTVNTGHMVLGPRAFDLLDHGIPLDEALAALAQNSVLGCVQCTGPLVTSDSIESLASAHRVLAIPEAD